jgi:putative membrane protein
VALIFYAVRPQWLTQRNAFEDAVTGAVFFLIVGGLVALSVRDKHEAIWLAATALIGTAIEVIGLATGWPFGEYVYTGSLQPQIAGFPPAVGLAWVLISWYAWHLSSGTRLSRTRRVMFAAAWLTGVDSVLDPVASGPLMSWIWGVQGDYHGVPLTNFLGWLLTGLIVFALAAVVMNGKDGANGSGPARDTALSIGFSILLFFTLLAAWYQLWIATLMGAALLGGHLRLSGVVQAGLGERD